MDESSWTPMQFEGGHPLVMSGDGVRDWFNGELDRLEKRRERGIFSAAQVNQPPPRLRTPEPDAPKSRNPENPKHPSSIRRALADPDSPRYARDPVLAIGPPL